MTTFKKEDLIHEIKQNQEIAKELGCSLQDVTAVRHSLNVEFGMSNLYDQLDRIATQLNELTYSSGGKSVADILIELDSTIYNAA